MPLIISWPSKISAGTTDALVTQIAFLHSFATLLELDLPDGAAVDSRNTLDALLGITEQGLPFMIEEANNALALRKDNWKYIEFHASKHKPKPGSPELYDLSEDIAEANNVIKDHPEIAESLRVQLHALQNSGAIT